MDVYQRRRLVALSAIAVVFIVFVLLVKSCGGSDTPSTATPLAGATGLGGATVLAQADYINQADAICLESNTSLSQVDTSDPAQAALDQAQVVSGELQQLQTLAPPDDGTDKLNKYLSSLTKQVAAYKDLATATSRADDSAVATTQTALDQAQTDADDSAHAFGFKVCGNPNKVGSSSSGGTTSSTASGGTVTPTTTTAVPTTPATPVTPPVDTGGGATPVTPPATPPATDGGGSSSGGVTP
jgi:hypothetical protein